MAQKSALADELVQTDEDIDPREYQQLIAQGVDPANLPPQQSETSLIEEQRGQMAAERDALRQERAGVPGLGQVRFDPSVSPAEQAEITRRLTAGGQPSILPQARQALSDYEKAVQEEQALRGQVAEQMKPEYERTIREMRGLPMPERPPVPQLVQPPKRESYIDQTAAKSLFTVASLMSALAMAGGRGRGMLAMAGMTGAIKGFQEGNAIRYNAGMDQYQEQVKNQLAEYRMMRQDYLDQMEARRSNLEELFAELQLKAKMYNDPLMEKAAQVKDLDGVLKHMKEIGTLEKDMTKGAGKSLATMPLKRQQWETMAKAAGYPSFDETPPAVQKQIMEEVEGLRAKQYRIERENFQRDVRTNLPIQPDKEMNWINENGMTPSNDPRFKEPASRTPQALGKAGYTFFGDVQVARAVRQSYIALTQMQRMERDVEELYKGVGPGENVANAINLKLKRGMGDATARRLRRTILETIPTVALTEGLTASRVGEIILGEFELPQYPTDDDTYASAKDAIRTIKQRLGNNITLMRGVGINPEIVTEAKGLATEAQSLTPQQRQRGGQDRGADKYEGTNNRGEKIYRRPDGSRYGVSP